MPMLEFRLDGSTITREVAPRIEIMPTPEALFLGNMREAGQNKCMTEDKRYINEG